MAQAKEKSTTSKTHFLIQPQAPEELKTQVLVKEPEKKQPQSRSIKNQFKKLFYNAKITEEIKCINAVKARLDTKMLGYRSAFVNF